MAAAEQGHRGQPLGTTLDPHRRAARDHAGGLSERAGLERRKTWVRTECAGPTWELSQLGDKALTIRAAWIAVGEKRPEDDPRCSESR